MLGLYGIVPNGGDPKNRCLPLKSTCHVVESNLESFVSLIRYFGSLPYLHNGGFIVVFSPIDLQSAFAGHEWPQLCRKRLCPSFGQRWARRATELLIWGAGIFFLGGGMFLLERSRLRCSSSTMTRTTLQFKSYMILTKSKRLTCHGSQHAGSGSFVSCMGTLPGTIPNQINPRYKAAASTALANIWRRCNAKVGNGLLSSSSAERFQGRFSKKCHGLFDDVWWVFGAIFVPIYGCLHYWWLVFTVIFVL